MNKKNKKTTEKVSKSNLIFGIINIAVVVGLAVLIVVLIVLNATNKKPNEQEKPKRFTDLTHITLNQYLALIDQGEPSDLPADLQQDIYVFIYDPDYDQCSNCQTLESIIEEKAKASDKPYSFFVLDYSDEKNAGIGDKLAQNNLPNSAVLVYIKGNSVSETHTNELAIKSALSKI